MRDAPDMLHDWQQYYNTHLDFLVLVLMGNDSYMQQDTMSMVENFVAWAKALRFAAAETLVVCGGNGALWQYDGKIKEEYDKRVTSTITQIRYELTCWTGAKVWNGLRVADRIGHADAASYPVIARGFVFITMIATRTSRLSRL